MEISIVPDEVFKMLIFVDFSFLFSLMFLFFFFGYFVFLLRNRAPRERLLY